MADNLTVGSPGAGNVEPRADRAGDPEKQKLERLRELAKKRTGRELTDEQLKEIISRQKEKIAQRAEAEESRTSFEAGRNKEAAVNKKNDVQLQAQEALASRDVRSARDGLTAKDRQSITSDPNASPKLPPAKAAPTTPEQAAQLLSSIVGFVSVGDLPFDAKAYAASLTKTPPNQPRTEPRATLRAPSGSSPQPMARTPSGATLQRGAPQPMPKLASSSSALTRPHAEAAVDKKSVVSQNPLSQTFFNAGGGLHSSESFDAMHFNWDGFFALFTMKHQESSQEYRKAMKHLRYLLSQVGISARELSIALLQLRHQVQRMEMAHQLGQTFDRAVEGFNKGMAQQITGRLGGAPQAQARLGDMLQLTQREIDAAGGDVSLAVQNREKARLKLYDKRQELERLTSEPGERTAERTKKIAELEKEIHQTETELDPRGAAIARARTQLQAFLRKHYSGGRATFDVNNPEYKALTEQYNRALEGRHDHEGRIFLLDHEIDALQPKALQDAYRQTLAGLVKQSGLAGYIGIMRAEAARLRRSGDPETAAQIEQAASLRQTAMEGSIAKMTVDQLRMLLPMRGEMVDRARAAASTRDNADRQLRVLQAELDRDPSQRQAILERMTVQQRRYDKAAEDELVSLRSVQAFDQATRNKVPMTPQAVNELVQQRDEARQEAAEATAEIERLRKLPESDATKEKIRQAEGTRGGADRRVRFYDELHLDVLRQEHQKALAQHGEGHATTQAAWQALEQQRDRDPSRAELSRSHQALRAAHGERDERTVAAKKALDAKDAEIAAASRSHENAFAAHPVSVSAAAGAPTEGDRYGHENLEREYLWEEQHRGYAFNSIRSDLDGPKWLRNVNKVLSFASQGMAALGGKPAESLYAVVDKQLNGFMGNIKKFEGELNAQMRQNMSQAQGMVNQLMQLLGMSRSS